MPKTSVVCLYCKKVFYEWISQKPRYCSLTCSRLAHKGRLAGEKHPFWKGGLPQCGICKKRTSHYYNKHCWRCWDKYIRIKVINRGKNHYEWKGGKNKCLDCGKQIDRKSRHCINCSWKYRRRENHGRWMGGLSALPYPVEFSRKSFKLSIRKRDNFTCSSCGKTETDEKRDFGCSLAVHHIDYDKNNLQETNLITVCKLCNSTANLNRDYWKNFYNERITKRC